MNPHKLQLRVTINWISSPPQSNRNVNITSTPDTQTGGGGDRKLYRPITPQEESAN